MRNSLFRGFRGLVAAPRGGCCPPCRDGLSVGETSWGVGALVYRYSLSTENSAEFVGWEVALEIAGTLRELCLEKCWPSAQALNQAASPPPATTQPAVQRSFTVTAGNANEPPNKCPIPCREYPDHLFPQSSNFVFPFSPKND